MTRRHFVTHTETTAPPSARPLLAGTRQQMGFLPAAVARQGESPALLGAFFHLLKVFDATSLTPMEREVVAFLVGARNGCELCVTLHRRKLGLLGAPPEWADNLEAGTAVDDARLDALAAFVRSVLALQGDVDESSWDRFLAAGFTRAQALEVILGVAAYTLSTYANRLVEAPVDLPAVERKAG